MTMVDDEEAVPLAQLPEPLKNSESSLYVGDLDPNVTHTDLLEVFSEIGVVSSVRICSDSVTGDSLRYGYVNFFDAEDASNIIKKENSLLISNSISAIIFNSIHLTASKALSVLNHTKLKGKSMRIMWCERDPKTRKNCSANLFVKNLNPSIDSAHLQSVFSLFGTIVSCKVAEENGKSKCFGFVRYDKEDSAVAALKAMHNTVLQGKKLYVAKFINRVQRRVTAEKKFTSLYVENLDEYLNEDVLQGKFSEFGTVRNVVIMKDSEGKSKGFGFVNFESPDSARKAAEALNETLLGSKKLFVGRAQRKTERKEAVKHTRVKVKSHRQVLKASNLFVKNLDPIIDDKMLEKHFSSCGEVTSAKVMRGPGGFSRGYGFVRFSKPAEAEKAFSTLHDSTLLGKPLSVAIARRKEHCQGAITNNRTQHVKPFNSGSPFLRSHSSIIHHPSAKQSLSTLYFPYYTNENHVSPLPPGWPNSFTKLYDPCSYIHLYSTAPKHVSHPKSSQPEVYQRYHVCSAGHNFQGNVRPHVPVKKLLHGNSTTVSVLRDEKEAIQKHENTTESHYFPSKNPAQEKKRFQCKTTASSSKAPAGTGLPAAAASRKSIKRHEHFLENLEPLCVPNPSTVHIEVNEAGLINLLASPNPLPYLVGKTVRVLKEVNTFSTANDAVPFPQKCSAEQMSCGLDNSKHFSI